MTAIARYGYSLPSSANAYQGIRAGRPVRSGHWQRIADMANTVMGAMPYQRVPTTHVDETVGTGSSITLRFRSTSFAVAFERIWVVQLDDPGGVNTYGTIAGEAFSLSNGPAEVVVRETQTRSTASDEITLTIAVDASADTSTTVRFVSCFDLPRLELLTDSTDVGADGATMAPRAPILDNSYGESVRGAELAVRSVYGRHARNVLQWSVDLTLGVSATSSTSFQSLDAFIVLAGQLQGETLRAAETWVYTNGNGEVRFTMNSGDVVTVAVSSASYTWTQGADLDVDAEVLSQPGGRPAAGNNVCFVEYRSTDGNAFGVRGVSLITR